jgi:predicted small lipoprotein YifL
MPLHFPPKNKYEAAVDARTPQKDNRFALLLSLLAV